MRKFVLTLSLAAAVSMVLAACGGSANDGGNTATNAGAATNESASGEVKAFTIDATNFAFEPTEIRVKKGDTVSITLKNSEGLHAVAFKGYNVEVKGNETISFTADQAGEFQYYCSIFCGAGHDDMIGTLIVEE